MHEASYYTKVTGNFTECYLCPHNCIISEGQRGNCSVRRNIEGVLYSEVYDQPIALNTDPIEKKPLYHFYPGSQVLSIGTRGCNLKCSFCQNFEISQITGNSNDIVVKKTMSEILELAHKKNNNTGIAYTYNEPVIFYEYMSELAELVHMSGMKNIMVSNGFINPEPLTGLLDLIDAFNIDLKSFSNDFYKHYTHATLKPVLESIKNIYKSGKHLELTFLVIPGLNDNTELFDEMTDWIVSETSKKTVLHISRYFPRYKMDIPTASVKIIEGLYYRARKKLDFVYVGNISDSGFQNSYCPVCYSLLIKRDGYFTSKEGIDDRGYCTSCGERVFYFITS